MHFPETKTVIEPQSRFSLGLNELWQYRELFYFFTWRDIKVKYKQTYLGVLWAVIQPLALMLLFTFVFANNFKLNSGGIKYEIFVLSGLILWNFFNAAISHGAESIIQQSNIIKKIYFPRLIIPGSALLTALFDFILTFIVFIIFCLIFNQPINASAFYVFPLSILFIIFSASGLGILLSALTVKFRDFRYIIPFLLQFLFFASQVVYLLSSLKPTSLKYILALNPVNGVIELFRTPLGLVPDIYVIGISFFTAVLLFISGIYYFRKTESYFADLA